MRRPTGHEPAAAPESIDRGILSRSPPRGRIFLRDDDGRRRYLPYLYLRDDEVAKLRSLARRGVSVAAQDVPTTRPVPLSELES